MIQKIKNKKFSPLVLNTAKMSFSNVIMYLLPVIVTPILSRLYCPQDFGEWGVFSSLITIVNIGLFIGFENTIVKAEKDTDSVSLCIISFLCSVIVIALLGIAFAVGTYFNVTFFTDFPAKTLLFVYLFLYSCYTIAYNLCNKKEKYNTLSFVSVIQGGCQALFRILFFTFTFCSFNGLILGTVTAQFFSATFLIINCIPILRRINFVDINIKRIKELIYNYRNFAIFDAPSSILSFAAFNMPTIILSLYFGKSEIGCFSIVIQLLLMPMSFVGAAMGRVYYQQISKPDQPKENLGKITYDVLRIVTIIAILPLLFLACGGDKIIVLFLGSQWEVAGKVSLCLALWSFPTILTQPLIPLFRNLNRLKTLLLYNAMYFVGGIGAIAVGCELSHNLFAILLVYSVICFIVKFLLFKKILTLSGCSIQSCKKASLIWGVACVILVIRLMYIF